MTVTIKTPADKIETFVTSLTTGRTISFVDYDQETNYSGVVTSISREDDSYQVTIVCGLDEVLQPDWEHCSVSLIAV